MELSFPEPYTAMTRERGWSQESQKADSGGTEDRSREHENCLEPLSKISDLTIKKIINIDMVVEREEDKV